MYDVLSEREPESIDEEENRRIVTKYRIMQSKENFKSWVQHVLQTDLSKLKTIEYTSQANLLSKFIKEL